MEAGTRVIPIKKLDFDTWTLIAARNNAKRAELGLSVWSGADSWELWRDFFSEDA